METDHAKHVKRSELYARFKALVQDHTLSSRDMPDMLVYTVDE